MSTLTATLAPTVDLAATLVDRILHVQKQYRRETGKRLSYADAFDEVVRRANACEPVDGDAEMTREDLEPVACLLAGLGYSTYAIEGALEDIGRCGSAQCSVFIDDADRDEIEALIPEVPADAWKGPRRKGLLWGGMVAR